MKINVAGSFILKPTIILLLASLRLVKGTRERSFNFTGSTSDPHTHTVYEGETVYLICQQKSDAVSIVGDKINYVTNGILNPSLPDNIKFTSTDGIHTIIISHVTRDNGDNFICIRQNDKYLNLKVIYSPSGDYPDCTTSYVNQLLFDDELQGPFQFNCTTEEGNPPVNISLYIEKEERTQEVNSSDLIITHQKYTKSLSFSSYLDSTFNFATLVCNVTQQLPAPYHRFQNACFFEISPTVSINIHLSNYTIVKERKIITLTCTSNVSGVALEWINIPLEDWEYNISMINDSLQLKIFDYESSIHGSAIFNCSGTFGGRVIFEYITINNDRGDKPGLPVFVFILVAIFLIIVFALISLIIFKKRYAITASNNFRM